MKRRELVDLLVDHADALNQGDGVAEQSLLPAVSSWLTLFYLARAVKRVLTPVELSPVFRSDLKVQLVESEMAVVGKRPFPLTFWLSVLVPVIGLVIFLLRRSRSAADGLVTAV